MVRRRGGPQNEQSLSYSEDNFVLAFKHIASRIHQTAVDKGWWISDRNDGEMIALMHSELSEALEGLREEGVSDHIPQFRAVEEELADVIIRIMDAAHQRGWRVPEAVIAKMLFNQSREFKHGGKSF